MNKKNSYESKSDNIQKKPSSRRNYIIEENLKKQHKKTSSIEINRKNNRIIYIERRIYISNNWKI